MKTILCLAGLALFVVGGLAQDATNTVIGQLEAETGRVLVLGTTEVGFISVAPDTRISVKVRETFGLTGARLYGLVIGIESQGGYRPTIISYVDDADVETLINAVKFLNLSDTSVTKLDLYEAKYKTKGGLLVQSWSKLGVHSAAAIGGHSATLQNLSDFQKLLEQGRDKLDGVRGGAGKAKAR